MFEELSLNEASPGQHVDMTVSLFMKPETNQVGCKRPLGKVCWAQLFLLVFIGRRLYIT